MRGTLGIGAWQEEAPLSVVSTVHVRQGALYPCSLPHRTQHLPVVTPLIWYHQVDSALRYLLSSHMQHLFAYATPLRICNTSSHMQHLFSYAKPHVNAQHTSLILPIKMRCCSSTPIPHRTWVWLCCTYQPSLCGAGELHAKSAVSVSLGLLRCVDRTTIIWKIRVEP